MGHGVARVDNTTGVPEPVPSAPGPSRSSGAPGLRRLISPPEPIGRAAWLLLGSLVAVTAGAGFQGSLPTVLMTYIADDFGANDNAQARALAFIRLDIVLTLVLVRAADRVGRRRMLLICATLGPVLTSLCALTNSLAQFTVLQIVSRAFVTAVAILVSVTIVEHLPAASRAWAAGTMVGAAALGSAVVQGASVIAERSSGGWRYPFLVPLVSLPVLFLTKQGLTESHRFERMTHDDEMMHLPTFTALRTHARRLGAVALLVGLIALQSNPARQLRSDFLRSHHGFTGGQLALFGLLTNAPGIFGVLVGTLVSDRRSRRIVISIALLGVAAGDAGIYLSSGRAIWMWSILGALLGAAALPGLTILTAELFPTAMRSTANGFTTLASRLAGFVGLFFVSFTTDRFFGGNQGAVVSTLSIALVLAVVVLWVATPETARRELEELNPEDSSLAET